ncbi:MAG: hypothetical protein DRP74_08145 [Candidatus Omnitrophota bacterium]|nr:MAG: hypothetical protein DRP74_08145 [Candidatus Omnitrophota bacterium]
MNRFTNKELSIIGALLYSCEGTRLRKDKRRKNDVYYWVIEFTNSDSNLIKLFITFLRKIIKIDESRLKGQLFIYDDLNKKSLEKRWSRATGIPLVNFNKTIIFKSKNMKYRPNPNGTFKIRYHSKEAFQKLDYLVNKILK